MRQGWRRSISSLDLLLSRITPREWLRFVCSSLFLSLHFVSLTSLTPDRRNASQETLLNIFLPLSSSYVSHFPHSQQLNYPSKTFPSSVSTL
jgi:hypothetical protein